MTPTDLRVLCTALSFSLVVMQGGNGPKEEGACRATAFAALIEEFCRQSVPDAFATAKDEGRGHAVCPGMFATAERMAKVIVRLYRGQGGCLPQDLLAEGFTAEEIDRYWAMAKALAFVEFNIKDS
jgi:hypothetical protein